MNEKCRYCSHPFNWREWKVEEVYNIICEERDAIIRKGNPISSFPYGPPKKSSGEKNTELDDYDINLTFKLEDMWDNKEITNIEHDKIWQLISEQSRRDEKLEKMLKGDVN